MEKEKISAIISMLVAITVLLASFFQWWDDDYNGHMKTRPWVKKFFCFCILFLFIALLLIL